MQQLTRVYQEYVTQITNPSTPLSKCGRFLSQAPLRIDAHTCIHTKIRMSRLMVVCQGHQVKVKVTET